MSGYDVFQNKQIGGKAPKWVLQGPDGRDDFYIVKFGAKNGHIEVLTELFNNQLGGLLGFEMAHSGIARLDEHLYFVTRNFRRGEMLVHGSLVVAAVLNEREEVLETIKPSVEQDFYGIDYIYQAIRDYTGKHAEAVFQKLIEMLVFDSLIGAADRHPKNWGVLRPEKDDLGAASFRLAPLFDSARALLWDHPEAKLLILDADPSAVERYARSSRPCIGPAKPHPKINGCNHFDLFSHLCECYPNQVASAYARIADKDVAGIARVLLRKFPFKRGFSSLRKRVIVKVLEVRSSFLGQVVQERGIQTDGMGITLQDAATAARSSV